MAIPPTCFIRQFAGYSEGDGFPYAPVFGGATGGPMKVFIAKVIGAAIIAGAFVCYQEYSRKRITEDVSRAMEITKETGPKTTFIVVPASTQSAQVEGKAQSSSPPDTSLQRDIALGVDEVCVNGETVRVGHDFDVIHEFSGSKPVRCFERSKLP